jgi:(S)-3,5-dihydroxyphenylglycine transaminase
MILDNGGSLAAIRKEKAAFYQRNLEVLLTELAAAFPAGSGVTWNAPPGGFFVVLDVPIHADVAALRVSAEKYGVLWTPMSFFHREDGGHRQLRLSVSYLDHPQITEGVRRLATFLADTERAQS